MIELSPGEMLFIGQSMQARYIDYQYATAIESAGDIPQLLKEGRDSLENKGLCEEDFSGKLEISDSVTELMNPVFFGEKVICITVAEVEHPERTKICNFHYYDNLVTKVTPANKGFSFDSVTVSQVSDVFDQIISDLDSETNGEKINIEQENDIKRIISVKELVMRQKSVVDIYFETKDGKYCEENENGDFISVISSDIKGKYKEV